ncbi:MAG: TIGR03960 family B12-binding radical SAM protein [Coriobacteriales bacterium]|nr:TIGR03960 family B12-binding radical SAM protein [Coriobacteriales bacterium]
MTRTSVWPQVEPLLTRVERPSRYLDREWGARHRDDASYRAVLVYPDTYEIGQANQALQILYAILNEIDDVGAERAYVPWIDMSAEMRAEGIPLFALESAAPIRDFDLVGFTLPYEMTYTNILEALDLAGIPLRAAERGDSDPLVIAGGPCAFNPEPVAAFFDAVVIGEADEAIVDFVRTHRAAIAAGLDRNATLVELAQVAGVYVPSLYDVCRDADGGFAGVSAEDPAPAVVVKRVVSDLGEQRPSSCPVVPFMDVVHDRLAMEVLRGCTRGCRFCQAGMIYRPVRERSADEVVREVMAGLACTGYDEVSLTSLSSTDHSQIEEILRRLKRRLSEGGVSVSLPSLRVDSFGVDMARLVAAGKKSGLTFAPEAGTQRLRDVINKNVTEEDLLTTVRRAFEAGWRRVKLYLMIGLPTETDDDVRGIGDLVQAVLGEARSATPADARGSVRVAVSVSTFVPKAHTPFQWEPQIPLDEVVRRQELLRSVVPRKGVDLSWHDAEVSFLEGAFARGGRELADVIEAAWRGGARFDAWTEQFDPRRWLGAFESCGVDPAAIASRMRTLGEPLPWGHISSGVSQAYLSRERERALTGTPTPDCSFDGCTGCDVCGDLGVTVLLGGDRRA